MLHVRVTRLCPLRHPSCQLCFLYGIWDSAGIIANCSSTLHGCAFILKCDLLSCHCRGMCPLFHYLGAVPLPRTLKDFELAPRFVPPYRLGTLFPGLLPLPGSGCFSSSPSLDEAFCHPRWTMDDPHPCDAFELFPSGLQQTRFDAVGRD